MLSFARRPHLEFLYKRVSRMRCFLAKGDDKMPSITRVQAGDSRERVCLLVLRRRARAVIDGVGLEKVAL